ncbi:MAG: cytochrome P450 [Actinomycetota bacterium]|nr:cytochrome P450 [Actinomycetota bacterium]
MTSIDGSADFDDVAERARGFDHLDPATAPAIHGFLRELRVGCPVAHSERHGGFHVVSRHDDIRRVALEHDNYSSAVAGLGAVMLLREFGQTNAPLFEQDPPEHSGRRKHLQPFFTRGAAENAAPLIREVTREVIASVAPRGAGDLVRDIARQIPPLIIGSLLGVPVAQRPVLRDLLDGFLTAGGLPPVEADLAVKRYSDFLVDQVRDRRADPGPDLLSAAVTTPVDGHVATEAELVKFTYLMIMAGALTTIDSIANTLHALAADPTLRDRVIADRSLLKPLIEESVRFESAVAATGRTVRAPTELAGVKLVPGDRLLLAWGSGNRDEDHFESPAEFDIDRDQGRQLGWGAGAHRCLGQHLARVEIGIVIDEVLNALPDYRLPDGFEPDRTYGVLRGIRSLPATWTT